MNKLTLVYVILVVLCLLLLLFISGQSGENTSLAGVFTESANALDNGKQGRVQSGMSKVTYLLAFLIAVIALASQFFV